MLRLEILSAPIVTFRTLCNVAGVSKGDHELIKGLGHLVHSKAGLLGCRGEPIAR